MNNIEFGSNPDASAAVALVSIICGCAVPVLIVGIALYFKHRREKLWHETTRLAIEKGQAIPPKLLANEDIKDIAAGAGWKKSCLNERHWKDIRTGLILMAVGGAFFLHEGGRRSFFYGGSIPSYILLGVGAAMLLNGLLYALFSRHRDDSGARPPQL